MTDKKTIELIEGISKKVVDLQIEQGQQGVKVNIIMWIMGAILIAGLPALGFLLAFWIEHK